MKQIHECSVLIVDDTEENIDILVGALSDTYELAVAMDGASALEAVEHELPDLILLDIMMPGMDGYEVCRRLKSDPKTVNIPIIFLTAMTDINSKTRAFEMGAVDYVTKPFEIAEVQARVLTHLTLKLTRQELAMQNEILEEKVVARTLEISLTQEATIDAMACLAEFRDPETGSHIKRTKNYVRRLAEELKKNPDYQSQVTDTWIDQLYRSAPLHDIGKVGVSDDVLFKPSKLSDTEYNEMKKHTLKGYLSLHIASQRLGQSSFLQTALELTRSHQERWDGSGYPDGLSGQQIPLSARIMAIADVYDALISRRVYKPPFSHEEAVAIIRESSGSHFDPQLVEAFLAIHEDFRAIAAKYADKAMEVLDT